MELNSMIDQGRRRYFVRRVVQKIALTAAVSLLVCAVLAACIRLGADVPVGLWAIAACPWLGLLIWAWPWRVPDIEIARQIDKANDFGERLSSAMSFMRVGTQSEWMKVQIADTMKRLDAPETADAFVRKAFAVQKPDHLRSSLILLGVAVFVMLIPTAAARIADMRQTAVTSDPDVVEMLTPNLDEVSQELRKQQADALLEAAEEIEDPALKEAAEELAAILKEDREGKLSAQEFERRLAALEKKISDMEQKDQAAQGAMGAKDQKAFDQAVREAVESMTQMKEDPETKALAEALEKNDYDKAADILNDLLNSTDPKDKKKLEKLAKMFGDLAKNIDPTDPELKEALKRNKDLVDKLKKEFDNDKLSAEDKKAFSDAAKKLKDAEDAQKKQQEASDKASKALNKLSKAMDNTSKSLDQKAHDADEDAQKQDAQKQQGAQKQDGQKGQEGQDGAQKEGQQESADGQEKGMKRDENGEHEGEDDASEGGESAEEALRDAAAQKKAQENRDALKDLADKMRKDAQSGDKGDKKDEARQKNMQDFMDRAKGKEKQEDAQESGQQQGNSGQSEQEGQQGADGQQQAQQGQQGGDGQQEMDNGQSEQSSSGSQDAGEAQLGKELGEQNGAPEGDLLPEGVQNGGHDTSLGEATSMKVNLKDEKLTGMDTGAQTTSEIIESAGQKGFASEPYREVYQTYEKAAEEVLESEEVPQGYRNYVEKYFDMIRPQ